jgi:hypothetical protein
MFLFCTMREWLRIVGNQEYIYTGDGRPGRRRLVLVLSLSSRPASGNHNLGIGHRVAVAAGVLSATPPSDAEAADGQYCSNQPAL